MAAPGRRGPRRADAPGTGPASADGPEPRLPGDLVPRQHDAPAPRQATQRTGAGHAEHPATGAGKGSAVVGKDGRTVPRAAGAPAEPTDALGRWLLEQRPPHWG